MREDLSLSTLIVFFCFVAIIVLLVTGCSDPYDECLEREKASYRERNPKASYGQVQGRQQDFELMCSKYKTKD